VGSPALAAVIAQVVFLILLVTGFISRQLSTAEIAFFFGLWLLVLFAGAYRPSWLPFSSCTAIIDIALVFRIFKGDIRLS
jgi:hypothetical protein